MHGIRQYVTVSPDQALAAVILRAETVHANGSAPQYEVGVYRLDDTHRVRQFKGQGMLSHKSWSANGRYLNLSTSNGCYIYDLESDRIVCQLKNKFEGSISDDGRTAGTIVYSVLTFQETLTGQVRHTIADQSSPGDDKSGGGVTDLVRQQTMCPSGQTPNTGSALMERAQCAATNQEGHHVSSPHI